MKLAVVSMLCLSMGASMVACGPTSDVTTNPPTTNPSTTNPPVTTTQPTTNPPTQKPFEKFDYGADGDYTYQTFTATSPSNWNELTYQDNNDTQIMSYLAGEFFRFDFKRDKDGEVVDGDFAIQMSAATELKDVTAKYGKNWGLTDEQIAEGSYVWSIKLRDDLKWDDGTPIKAEDFVYSMQEQLNPLFKNYRADSFYNSGTVIHNARGYAKQGESGTFSARDIYSTYSAENDSNLIFALGNPSIGVRGAMGFPANWTADRVAGYLIANYLGESAFTADVAAKMEGKTLAEIKADATLKAGWDALIGWWQTMPDEELDFFISDYTFPAVDFKDVGLFVGESDLELVIALDKTINLLDENDEMTYLCAYQLSSLPLVKKDLYEKNKVAPVEGSTLWTSTYNSNVETSASWGPYKLTSFQAGKQYVLERNPNWYGWNMEEFYGQYQTDKIVCETVAEWNTAWSMFQKGQLEDIAIDVTIADDYKNSKQAYFTPSDFVGSMQLQSSKEALKNREKEGVNKTILSYVDFRKALSLGIDRADYCQKCTTSSLPGFGLFNSMHYYDVAHGGAYRNTEVARETLLKTYGFTKNANGTWTDGKNTYVDTEEAEEAITGLNLELARQLMTKAYEEALAAGDIKATDKVVLTFGSAEDSEAVRRHWNFLNEAFKNIAVGTPLEGRLEVEFDASFGTTWADSFRAGAYDICLGGWTGAAWDPGYFLLAYLSPDYMYSTAWDTSTASMTFTMPKGGKDGEDVTLTMSLMDWYECLNGTSTTQPYNWSAGMIADESRLALIAALEEQILSVYYTVPLRNSFDASLRSFKINYETYDYNTFMAYGGIRYITYNYTDAAWADYVKAQGGTLNYK